MKSSANASSRASELLVTVGFWIILTLAMLSLSCSKFPYRLNIQQGNVITQEMVDKLEPGMDKRKVEFILGTPLVTDVFNQDRWDYVYTFKPSGGEMTERRLILFFENEQLARIEGDIQPSVGPQDEAPRSDTVVTVPDSRKKRGIFATIGGWFSRDEDTTLPESSPDKPQPEEQQPAEQPPVSE